MANEFIPTLGHTLIHPRTQGVKSAHRSERTAISSIGRVAAGLKGMNAVHK
jgi:hypothetical protein